MLINELWSYEDTNIQQEKYLRYTEEITKCNVMFSVALNSVLKIKFATKNNKI